MRILIIVEAIPPYCGGGEQIAWMNAVELAKSDTVSIITYGVRDYVETKENVKIYYLKKEAKQFLYYLTKGRIKLNQYIKEIKPDIIHSHMPFVLHFCLRKKGKLISTIHDGVPESKWNVIERHSFYHRLKLKIIRKVGIFKSDYITCVSYHNYRIMTNLYKYKKNKFKVFPNCINDSFFSPVQNSTGVYILNFGRQIDLKMGPLIKTAQLMPKYNFKFMGSGPMVNSCTQDNIEFLGFKSDLNSIIDNAVICVFPSLSENFPLVGLEAMARGKPVIATKIGFSEYIEHNVNGLLINNPKPVMIKNAITKLINDKELYLKISINARKTADMYHSKKIMDKYRRFYHYILKDEKRNETT